MRRKIKTREDGYAMTNDELNQYILHYLKADLTHRAIMLTGAWGIGKSYYIQNALIPFLKKSKCEYDCIAVSLYGLKSTAEISRSLYWGIRAKRFLPNNEAMAAGKLIAKNLIGSLLNHCEISLCTTNYDLQTLYESINLAKKLIIFEDIERSRIDILDFLGYVNSLVDQDQVKVLLVANESEILKYDETEDPDIQDSVDGLLQGAETYTVKNPTRHTLKYLATKEKVVSDTIPFAGNCTSAISEILQSFGAPLKKFVNDSSIRVIYDIMSRCDCSNLRSFIFACQKYTDILELANDPIGKMDETTRDCFIPCIFYGILNFVFRFKAGKTALWDGGEHYSIKLGSEDFPLFKFCYEYITKQKFEVKQVPDAAEALSKKRQYSTTADPDLRILYSYSTHYEQEVRQAIQSVSQKLKSQNEIGFYEYGSIAAYSIIVKHLLGVDIEDIKTQLVANLHGQGNEVEFEELFQTVIEVDDASVTQEYNDLCFEMSASLKADPKFFAEFTYSPERAYDFCKYAQENSGKFLSQGYFAAKLDLKRLSQMFFECSPEQKHFIRAAFSSVYHAECIKPFLAEDAASIAKLHDLLVKDMEKETGDKIQSLQYRWFTKYLNDILAKL